MPTVCELKVALRKIDPKAKISMNKAGLMEAMYGTMASTNPSAPSAPKAKAKAKAKPKPEGKAIPKINQAKIDAMLKTAKAGVSKKKVSDMINVVKLAKAKKESAPAPKPAKKPDNLPFHLMMNIRKMATDSSKNDAYLNNLNKRTRHFNNMSVMEHYKWERILARSKRKKFMNKPLKAIQKIISMEIKGINEHNRNGTKEEIPRYMNELDYYKLILVQGENFRTPEAQAYKKAFGLPLNPIFKEDNDTPKAFILKLMAKHNTKERNYFNWEDYESEGSDGFCSAYLYTGLNEKVNGDGTNIRGLKGDALEEFEKQRNREYQRKRRDLHKRQDERGCK
jgi:hypothetical protein